ncbi:MAG: endonuclease/exonuclease/phosphatase family protein [Anaerolineae bacterium]|nr:endonuclease/exonuclease/phosphatase family protein [Anaerolineae bacterium]
MRDLKILSWNLGGAKFLRLVGSERCEFKQQLNFQLQRLAEAYQPDFMVFQEIVQYRENPRSIPSRPQNLVEAPPGYYYKPSIAISTDQHKHPGKWEKYRLDGGWPTDAYLAQGCGLLWREDITHCSIWDLDRCGTGPDIQLEWVHLDTGLYTGDRDTEPRLAVVAHFVCQASEGPLDVFIVNLHLTTLKGEREGLPERDKLGIRTRMAQIDTVLYGIVSRYNDWRRQKLTLRDETRAPAVWILAGDFNCVPDSAEIRTLQAMNFLDLHPHKGAGTKGVGLAPSEATITVDYIFAGPKYVALNPFIAEQCVQANPKPLSNIAVSDHFPLIAQLPIETDL